MESHIRFAESQLKFIDNSTDFVDGAGTHLIVENAVGVAGLAGGAELPVGRFGAGGSG